MAASTGVIGYGSYIQYSSTSGGSYSTVAEVLDISDDEMVDKPEFTHLLSDNRTKEYKPGMYEPGETTFTMNFTKTQYATMISLRGSTYYWKIFDSDGSVTGPFPAFWTKRSKKSTTKDAITCDITLQRTGVPNFTAAA